MIGEGKGLQLILGCFRGREGRVLILVVSEVGALSL